jgi:hypothetical protein
LSLLEKQIRYAAHPDQINVMTEDPFELLQLLENQEVDLPIFKVGFHVHPNNLHVALSTQILFVTTTLSHLYKS